MFCISSCPTYSFVVDLLKSNDHVTALGYLEISSAKEISPLLFNLASGRFLRQKQKAYQIIVRLPQKWFLVQLILFPSET